MDKKDFFISKSPTKVPLPDIEWSEEEETWGEEEETQEPEEQVLIREV